MTTGWKERIADDQPISSREWEGDNARADHIFREHWHTVTSARTNHGDGKTSN